MKVQSILARFLVLAAVLFVLAAMLLPALNKAGGRARYCPTASLMAHGGSAVPNGQAYDAMFFENYGVNPFIDTEDDALSTFAVDVDTASYALCRSYIRDGHLPPKDAVRVEEFVNYMPYQVAGPEGEDFSVELEGSPSWFGGPKYRLLRVAIKGREVELEDRKPAVLTFVIDVSGSMARGDRLGLVKRSLKMLLDQLTEEDQVGIVVYGCRAREVLPHCGLEERARIFRAIEALSPSGSTYAQEGLEVGYRAARDAFRPGAVNRVILCSDGVANVGATGAEEILQRIEEYAEDGIQLTALGFGMGNYNDVLMEKLADKGDGHYAYVDTLTEARRILVEDITGTLQVIARDMKVQVAFNPDVVARYRLLGYENRAVADEDFRDDQVDGGEVGAGHQVTALYEIKLQKGVTEGEVAAVHLRYLSCDDEARIVERSEGIRRSEFWNSPEDTSPEQRLAASVAEFSEVLRSSYWAQEGDLGEVMVLLQGLPESYRARIEVAECINLVAQVMEMQA